MKDYDIIVCLNWILKTQILQYLGKYNSELNTRSIESIIKRNYFRGKIWLSQIQLWGTALTASQPCLLDFNHLDLSYLIKKPLGTSY